MFLLETVLWTSFWILSGFILASFWDIFWVRKWVEALQKESKKEILAADPKKFVADPKKYRAKWGFAWFLEASRGRLWGALVRFLVQSVSKKGAKRMSERDQKGAEK